MNRSENPARLIRLCVLFVSAAALLVALTSTFFSIDSLTPQLALAILLFAAFAALATNLEIVVRSGFGLGGHIMILIASVVVFRESSVFIGPVIVGAFGGLNLTQIRQREWDKVAFNTAADSLSIAAGAAVFWATTSSAENSPLILLGTTALAASAYLLSNAALIGLPISIANGERYGVVLVQLIRFNVSAYPFALLGLGLGFVYMELGAAVFPLIVAPILIARHSYASYVQLKTAQENTIETLIRALEAKDRYTAGHAQRVAKFSSYIAEEFAFGPRRAERLRYAALMHDIGKLIVPNQLLNKPGRLTEAEFDRVRLHESVSVELLRRIDFLAPVAGDTTTAAATAAVDHGNDLVEPAIIHVADAFDAMTSTRSYRRALSQETAFDELRKGAGTQFNAKCVDALIAAIERRGEAYGDGHEVEEHEWAVAPPEAGTGSAGLGHLVAEEQVSPK
jgi:HD superfamily phosphohydrolase YqeK